MKIIIIGSAYPFRGGLAAYNERMAKEFTKMGHEVSIHTFTIQYPNFLFPGKTQFSEEPPPNDLDIQRTVSSINPLNWFKVGNRIKKENADIVIFKYWLPFMGPCFGTIARRIRKNKRTKIITVLDNVIPHEKRIGDKMFTRYFLKPIHAFIAMSESVREDLRLFEPNKKCLINPHPLFDNFGEIIPKREAQSLLNLDPKLKYILFFGIIRDYKGLDLLIDAFATMAKTHPELRLIVAGEYYSNEDQYIKQIESYQLQDRIIVVNKFITDSEVNRYFCSADIVAQPYKSATQSGVTQIAYHFEIPMLVTNVGGLPEIVPHGKIGYVCEVDAASITEHLARFFDEEKEAEFKTQLKEEKKLFEWRKLTDKIVHLASNND